MRLFMLCTAAAVLLLAGCHHDSPVISGSVEVISVDPAFSDAVNRAMIEVHDDLAKWVVEGDKKSDPTYKAGSRTWKQDDNAGATVKCSRGYIEFRTNKDILVRLETVFVADRSLLVLINCDDEQEAMRAHNTAVAKIRSQCADAG